MPLVYFEGRVGRLDEHGSCPHCAADWKHEGLLEVVIEEYYDKPAEYRCPACKFTWRRFLLSL